MRAHALRRPELREVGVVFHHDLSYAMSDPSSIEFLRGVVKEIDERHLTLQVIPKMGRQLMLAAAFKTTADVLIVHAEIGPEFVPELRAARKPNGRSRDGALTRWWRSSGSTTSLPRPRQA